MLKIALAALLVFMLFTQGCVNSDSARMGDASYPPRPENYHIDVYVPAEAPVAISNAITDAKSVSITSSTTQDEMLAMFPPGTTLVGKIDVNGAQAASWESVIESAKKKARELGGDGILLGQWGQPLTGYGPYGLANYGKAASFAVLRYK